MKFEKHTYIPMPELVLYRLIIASNIAEYAFMPHAISHTETPTRHPISSGLPYNLINND